jgi:hypothetical protein
MLSKKFAIAIKNMNNGVWQNFLFAHAKKAKAFDPIFLFSLPTTPAFLLA